MYVDRVCLTYVDKVGKNCMNCKRNLGRGGDMTRLNVLATFLKSLNCMNCKSFFNGGRKGT